MTCYAQLIFRNEKGSQNIYRCLLPENDNITARERWRRCGIENVNWEETHLKVDKSLDCSKLKWLQIRINNKILSTNKSISKFKEDQSPLCTFCKTEEEDIAHLLYECKIVNKFWKDFEQRIRTRCPRATFNEIPKQVVLLGTAQNFFTDPTFDMLLVMAKHYIYRQKVRGDTLSITAFMLEIKTRFLVDRYNANIHHHNSYEAKWRVFKPLFSEYLQ